MARFGRLMAFGSQLASIGTSPAAIADTRRDSTPPSAASAAFTDLLAVQVSAGRPGL